MFPWGTSSCAPPRIRRLTFFCSCRRMSSQRKDQEYKRPARTTAGIRVCPSVWLVSLSACEVRAPSPSLPREARAAGLAPSDGWQRHDRAPAPAGRMRPRHPPAPHLAPSWHQGARGTGAATPRAGPAASSPPTLPCRACTPWHHQVLLATSSPQAWHGGPAAAGTCHATGGPAWRHPPSCQRHRTAARRLAFRQ